MGLTRIRADQISDIDYKQATRVITLSDITLSGGAPATVDGVSLQLLDRILVAGQSDGAENGLYQVTTLGTGSNGTWARTNDGNETGEIEAGMIVMVTEGTTYADTQWKLTTNDPIVIGTTALTFEQNSAYAFGNIYANTTAVLANTVGDTLTLTAGDNIAISANAATKTINIAVTGISLTSIANGTSNVNVTSAGGNVTVGVADSEVAKFSSVGQDLTGALVVSGNVTGGNLNTGAQVVATGNVTGGNLNTAGAVTGNGRALTSLDASNLDTGTVPSSRLSGTYTITVSGSATTAGTVTTAAQPNITSVGTLSSVTVTGNATAGNVSTAGVITATGNVTGGNLTTTGQITATGNITGGNILGNGAGLSGLNIFSTINADNTANIAASGTSDTLIFEAGSGISISGSSGNVIIALSASENFFATGGDMGSVVDAVTESVDAGLIADTPPTDEYDWGAIAVTGVFYPELFVLPPYTVATLPTNASIGAMIYVTDASGGAVPAFGDGVNWRRVTDRAVVT